MAPDYKLYYFQIRWLAEPARWLFALAKQAYTDVRVAQEDWPRYKQKMPLGKMPVLEVDGKQLAQSKAIYRYLAKEFGLVGETDLDQARGDMIVDYVEDMVKDFPGIFFPETEEQKQKNIEGFAKDLPVALTNFEKILSENNDGNGFFVGDKVTWSDVVFVSFMDVIMDHKDILKKAEDEQGLSLDEYPKIEGLMKRVKEIPAIAAWIKSRRINPVFNF